MGIELHREGGVLEVVLHHPPVNVLGVEELERLVTVLEEVRAKRPQVTVLRGEGKGFCAGLAVEAHLPDSVGPMLDAFTRVFRAMARVPGPLVAAVHGPVLGGGLELACFCDMIWAAEGAVLGQPEVKVGAWPPVALVLLPAVVGRLNTLDLVLSGRTLSAGEARAVGLVQRVFPKGEEFLAEVRRQAAEMAGLSPAVLASAKAAARMDDSGILDAVEGMNRRYLETLVPLADYEEGLRAFMEKRRPRWDASRGGETR